MNTFENESYHIWHPDLYEILQQAINQKSEVIIQSHLPLDLCNSGDVSLVGKILAITDQKAQFIVDDFDVETGSVFLSAPACEYSFAVNMPVGKQGLTKVEYSGRAVILDRSLQKNNIPDGLLLRISLPSRIRHARMHPRRQCPEGQIVMPGLVLVDHEPAEKRRLLSLLGHYYRRKNRLLPQIINISAGGVCLQPLEPGSQRILSAEENYLFFFFHHRPRPGDKPIIFLGKKVGIFRGMDALHPALRIQFLKELVWNDAFGDIHWQEIDGHGSPTLKKLMAKWKSETEARLKEE